MIIDRLVAALGVGPLFGQTELLTSLTDRFSGRATGFGGSFTAWGALLSVLAAVWWLSAISLRRRAGRKVDSPRRLFRELCRAHRLSWRETALLHELSEARGLDTPLEFFVRDDHFDFAPDALGATTAAEARRLREKLFAAPPESLPSDDERPASAA